ncbi:MAG TPA: aldose 1-epimerase [Ferruginibacter sp.]|nr:aldose 1-epimerase [Ferruginibacter sp.]
MFSVTAKNEDGFDKIVLRDESSETSAELLPACGAILHAFTVRHNGAILNMIDNYSSAADFKKNVTGQGFKSCKLSPFACRINNGRYRFAGKEYTIEKFMLGEHALHGLLFDAVFSVTGQHADEEKATITMLHEYRATDKGYPFKYDCIVTYELRKDNSLGIITELVNKDDGIIPIQDGWHPYFTLGGKIDDLQLEFQSNEMVEFDAGMIPTGKLSHYEEFGSLKKIGDKRFDNCFTVDLTECQPLCVLRDAKKKLQIEIYPGASYPYLQLYTPPHRNSIAIENLSAAPDAFNNGMGLISLFPGLTAVFKTTYKITSLN